MGHFSCACNCPSYAERCHDLEAWVLSWNQNHLGSLPTGFPAIASKKWQQKNQKVMTPNAEKKIRIEINLLILIPSFSSTPTLNAFAARRGGCVMLVAKLCQGRALWFFKSCFDQFWKSVSCYRKSKHTVLCTSGLENPSVPLTWKCSLHLENAAGGAASSYLPSWPTELHYFPLYYA